MQNILSFIFVLGLLIFIHELGHFLFAKLFKVSVLKFSIGFGPKIFGRKIGETEYVISLLPFGGFVKMLGENPTEPIKEEEKPFSFSHKKLYQKFIIVALGPIFNFLLGFIVFFFIFFTTGTYTLKPIVGEVKENSPAYNAGIKSNDEIYLIDNQKIKEWQDISTAINKYSNKPLEVVVIRDSETITFNVVPESSLDKNVFGEEIQRFVIGIASNEKALINQKLSFIQSLNKSIYSTYQMIKLTFLSIVKLVQGKLDTKNIGGPIMIAKIAGEKASEGISSLMFFVAVLSINLGVLNLLPIPVLDGGHLLFFTIEGIIRKPISLKIQERFNQVGMFLLLMLMAYVIYNDVLRIIIN